MADRRILVSWLAEGDPPSDNGDITFEVPGFDEMTTWRADVVVLDVRSFESADVLLRRRRGINKPVLALVEEASLALVVQGLEEHDDFCRVDAPGIAIVERIRRMHRRALPRRDRLTGLIDRRSFTRDLREACAAAGEPEPCSLILFDLDHFKAINDEHGHTMGDRILVGVAERLLMEVAEHVVTPTTDDVLVARVGGEEFGVLLRAGRDQAMQLAEAVLERIRAESIEELAITASAGVATAVRPLESSKLYHQSDEAMYAAKAGGRDRTLHFSDLERAAMEDKRDLALEGFQNRTRVITERAAEVIASRGRRLMEELRSEADLDPLTALFSRRYLDRRLPFDFGISVEDDGPLTVALLDVDHFGLVNKEHGWPTGDRVLAEIARRVRSCVRATDWVARYGGEEFCIVMHDLSDDDASSVLERLRADVADVPFATNGSDIRVTVSIGAARRSGDDADLAALVERVSAQLLDAKNSGRNRVSFA